MNELSFMGKKTRIDWTLVILTVMLTIFGLLMMYSASSYNAQTQMGDEAWYVKRQLIPTAVGLVGFLFMMFVPYRFWNNKVSIAIFIFSLMLTLMVLTPMGISSNGASRWINLKIFTLQPSEVVKLGLILISAYILSKYEKYLQNIKLFLVVSLPTLAGAGIVALITDDLGTAIVLFGMGIIMMFVACKKKSYIALLVGAIGLIGVIFIVTKEYRMDRIRAWLNLEENADDLSYQIMQGLYAIGSGGLLGKGFGKSTQKMDFVPECENDMIFSIVCEELGIIGAIGLLAIFVLLLWRLYQLYKNTDVLFGKLIIAGVMGHIGVQTLLNVGVVTSLLPNTGVPLPFISYGGSSIIIILTEIGLVESVVHTKPLEPKKEEIPVRIVTLRNGAKKIVRI